MQFKIGKKIILLPLFLSIITGLVFPVFFVSALATYDSAQICESDAWQTECDKLSKEDCQALCNQCLNYFNQKSQQIQTEIDATGQKKKTLQNEVSTL
ncbi:MAG: hypothetical protein PHG23_03855, partial [Candidatus Pacebacteria bacterium]|nr:hypothetical protein [Candidatus Paceibacterota bacterium]